ncbi:hypothetical protein IV02_20545 [Pseudomonas syringae]|jgi:hypothetical protein|uniref:Lipoprotein n=2 Tax=Pseudomonas TaxID=286 RepID=A0A085V0S6_PSESX|nr:hypothetical protein CFII64_06925 [Pseudomonas sp. CFII64]KFE49039.1 hypothetical protein IV02_20545 [Pseudomonas syringae]
MMKSKMTSLVLTGLLSISSMSAFAAGESSTGPVKPETGGATQSGSAMPPGTHPSAPSGSTDADAYGRGTGTGAGKSADGGDTGSGVGKTGGPNKNGPNGTGGGASGSDDN